jgi:hypothetical protein
MDSRTLYARKPLAKKPAWPAISSLCGMGDYSDCSGFSPMKGRGRLIPCECRCGHVATKTA